MSSYLVIIVCTSTQYISVLLDIVIPLNESRPRKLLIITEYFVDQDKYFYVLTIHVTIGILFVVTTAVAAETFALANAIYAFGLFKIAKYAEFSHFF